MSTATRALLLLTVSVPAYAEPTLELEVRGAQEVLKGDPETTAVDAQGRIELGLSEVLLGEGAGRPAVALALDKSGAPWLGTAGGGLVHLRPGAPPRVIEPAPGLVVSAVAPDERGGVWFATAPKAQIQRFDGRAVKPMLAVEAEYVWALLPEKDGVLAVTGVPGQLVRVRGGKAEVLFASSETHLRALARHPAGGWLVGGGEKGIIYHVEPNRSARALWDADLEEVTSFAVASDGTVYASLVSGSKKGVLDPGTWIGRVGAETEAEDGPIKGSEVIRIRKSGEVDRLWSSQSEGALALALGPAAERLYLATGTGAKGRARVYAVEVENRDRVVLVARLGPPMATGLVRASDGALVVSTAPNGQVSRLGPGLRSAGTYLSEVQNLRRVGRIGSIWFDAETPDGSRVALSIRTGNTNDADETWSAWSRAVTEPGGETIEVPSGRYAQFRAELGAGRGGASPRLDGLSASVRRRNLAPSIHDVHPLRPGIYLRPLPVESETEKTVTVTGALLGKLRRPVSGGDDSPRARAGFEPGARTISFRASDPNGDALLAWVEIVPESGPPTVLAEALDVPFVSFDARAHPDGRYRARVRVSDRPSNAPDEALDDVRLSEPFLIDHTPPTIQSLTARRQGKRLEVDLRATDATSRLGGAELALDGGPWVLLPPADGLVDQQSERFVLGLDDPGSIGGRPSPPHVVRVRVEDAEGNRVSDTVNVAR